MAGTFSRAQQRGLEADLGKGTDKVSVLGSGCAPLPFVDWSGLASSVQLPGKHRLERSRRTDPRSAGSRPRLRGRASSSPGAFPLGLRAPHRLVLLGSRTLGPPSHWD